MLLCVKKTGPETDNDGIEEQCEEEANFTVYFCNPRNCFTTSISPTP